MTARSCRFPPLPAVLLSCWLGLLGGATAQPFPAAGGFDRPFPIGRTDNVPDVAIAASGDRVYAYWRDQNGILGRELADPEATTERLLEARGVRDVEAVTVGGEPALGWVQRDITTGISRHVVRWRGEERLFLESPQPLAMALAAGQGGPVALFGIPVGGNSSLVLKSWDGGELTVHASELNLTKFSLGIDARGVAHVTWLEGFSDRAAVGFSFAEWTAFHATVDPTGKVTVSELGPARNDGIRDRTLVSAAGAEPYLFWPDERGTVRFRPVGGETQELGPGLPLGVSQGELFWIDEASIRRRPVAAGSEPVNAVWSPNRPELGALLVRGDHRFLAWYGGFVGGGFALFGSNDLTPIRLTWRDRIAARMGWNPYGFWQALGGQLVASLFAGIMITLLLSPLYWLGSLFISRFGVTRRPPLQGVLLCLGLLLVGTLLIWWRSILPADTTRALLGNPLELAVAFLAGAVVSLLLLRKADQELQITILLSACLTSATSLSILSFLNFGAWAELWGQVV